MKKCRKCGWCCRNLILEADTYDAKKEPRIPAEAVRMDGNGRFTDEEDVWYCLNGNVETGDGIACIFLVDTPKGPRCSIYKTRPLMCKGFGPHDQRCKHYGEIL